MQPVTIEHLRRAAEALPPGSSITLPRETLLDALIDVADAPQQTPTEPPDRLLNAAEVAKRLGVSRKYVYSHAGTFPFTRRLGDQTLRFSERALERWLARQR